ncbi:hypothetical protein SERLA73DRAFT_134077 [Serpula lacrymans var. lacrymans S7.3]|uniref:Uncharacterized protein n=2 Tax=Serpula lacrymans var. lacrymans TaxID=341189 RepID=F8PTB2_SERL3|nr:uncharacterized protein SERLADRAFT_385366 [Serpula lacrymans var. lacrymans S7.9]EGO00942.1 hypothetical protein SERLA73DRAFT_134077 [Serpula lacrymans var. lacrymans S7.3]EGO26561.1 hypothetical protein SERLADRAFT_385366 [Serpula lacrymans var. lacrymans S7.9]
MAWALTGRQTSANNTEPNQQQPNSFQTLSSLNRFPGTSAGHTCNSIISTLPDAIETLAKFHVKELLVEVEHMKHAISTYLQGRQFLDQIEANWSF